MTTETAAPDRAGDGAALARRFLGRPRLALVPLLALQAGLSLWLTRLNTAFMDEATYINTGHAELAGLLHGVYVPQFPALLSGAPVVYPPLAAVADSVAGLTGARLVSLAFMLVTTGLLWSTSRRLLGSNVAFWGTLLWAGAAPTLFLGALATYDSMALFLLVAAFWCATRAAEVKGARFITALGVCGLLLVLAVMAKYASLLWEPTVLLVAALLIGRRRGWRIAALAGGALLAGTGGVLFGLYGLAGPVYRRGVDFTTLERHADHVRTSLILGDTARLIGAATLLALIGAALLTYRFGRSDPALAIVAWLLALAVLLAPLNELRLHTVTSLFKHTGFGLAFAVLPAGYAVARLWDAVRAGRASSRRWVGLTGSVAMVGVIAAGLLYLGTGAAQSSAQFRSWPNASRILPALRRLTHDGGFYLSDEDSIFLYYTSARPRQWADTFYLHYRSAAGLAAYRLALEQHHFRLVLFSFAYTPGLDDRLDHLLGRIPGYRLVATANEGPGGHGHRFVLWEYLPPRPIGR